MSKEGRRTPREKMGCQAHWSLLGGFCWNPDNRNCVYDRNLYWHVSGKPLLFQDKGLAEWQAAGHDLHSLIADPLFVDPEGGDFRLRPGSPAARIGFEPWDLTAVGPRPDPASKRKAGR